MHDSQELDGLLDESNTCNDVFADSAYRSAEIEAKLRAHRSAFRLGCPVVPHLPRVLVRKAYRRTDGR